MKIRGDAPPRGRVSVSPGEAYALGFWAEVAERG